MIEAVICLVVVFLIVKSGLSESERDFSAAQMALVAGAFFFSMFVALGALDPTFASFLDFLGLNPNQQAVVARGRGARCVGTLAQREAAFWAGFGVVCVILGCIAFRKYGKGAIAVAAVFFLLILFEHPFMADSSSGGSLSRGLYTRSCESRF